MLYVEFIVVFSGAAAITTIICSGFNLTLQVNFIIPALTTITVQIAVFITFLIVDVSITSLIFAITSCGMAHGCLHIALLGKLFIWKTDKFLLGIRLDNMGCLL